MTSKSQRLIFYSGCLCSLFDFMDEKKLEGKFLYRLVYLAYISGLLLFGLIVVWVGWENRPQPFIDGEKSTINCNNGKRYSLNSVSIYIFTGETKLDSYDDVKARKACEYAIKDDYIENYKTPQYQNYTLNVVNSTRGSWGSAFSWWVFGGLGVYIVLSILREALLYLFLGKPFSWEWFKRLNS